MNISYMLEEDWGVSSDSEVVEEDSRTVLTKIKDFILGLLL